MQNEQKPFKKCENCPTALYCDGQKKCAAEMFEDPSWKILDGVHVHCKPNGMDEGRRTQDSAYTTDAL